MFDTILKILCVAMLSGVVVFVWGFIFVIACQIWGDRPR